MYDAASLPCHRACKAKKLTCAILPEQRGEKLRSLGIWRIWWLEVVGTVRLMQETMRGPPNYSTRSGSGRDSAGVGSGGDHQRGPHRMCWGSWDSRVDGDKVILGRMDPFLPSDLILYHAPSIWVRNASAERSPLNSQL